MATVCHSDLEQILQRTCTLMGSAAETYDAEVERNREQIKERTARILEHRKHIDDLLPSSSPPTGNLCCEDTSLQCDLVCPAKQFERHHGECVEDALARARAQYASILGYYTSLTAAQERCLAALKGEELNLQRKLQGLRHRVKMYRGMVGAGVKLPEVQSYMEEKSSEAQACHAPADWHASPDGTRDGTHSSPETSLGSSHGSPESNRSTPESNHSISPSSSPSSSPSPTTPESSGRRRTSSFVCLSPRQPQPLPVSSQRPMESGTTAASSPSKPLEHINPAAPLATTGAPPLCVTPDDPRAFQS
eukprot:TRINITY_DN5662_c0_g2_i1.p1 TRINITY_DN5662_c0_g2~~TRINITY_DN5662_c0_g2_i1.p1  ORF type:complete len:348 (-),score=41.38 TRINITY_DN5662_c0_g2_i1:1247-2164(-)